MWRFSIVYERYRLFEDCWSEITQTSIPETPSGWKAPAARCDKYLQDLRSSYRDLCITEPTTGWQAFQTCCVPRSSAGRTPMLHSDWICYSDLGMALWSRRRLTLDLALGSHRRTEFFLNACRVTQRSPGGRFVVIAYLPKLISGIASILSRK